MRTRNITIAVSTEAHHKARLWAAEFDVSLSAILSALLENLPANPNAARIARSIGRQSADTPLPPPPPCETVNRADVVA